MPVKRYVLPALLSCLFACTIAHPQEITTTISEPGRYTIAELYNAADVVAIVHLLAGDTEHYASAIYKARVVTAYKGAENGSILYFGPYVGFRIGTEYLLFLKHGGGMAIPKPSADAMFGSVAFGDVFNEGYSSMGSAYQCGFDGTDAKQSCDDAIRVCTDYIKLPKQTKTSPAQSEETPFGCRWVRKTEMEALLQQIASGSRNR